MAIQRACILTEWIHFLPHFRCQTRFRHERQGAVISGLWRLTDTLHFLETLIGRSECRTWTILHPSVPRKLGSFLKLFRRPETHLTQDTVLPQCCIFLPPWFPHHHLPHHVPSHYQLSPRSGLDLSLTESPPSFGALTCPTDKRYEPGASWIDLLNSTLGYMRTKLRSASTSESNEEAVVDGNGTAVEAVHPQPQRRFLLNPPRRVVHKASGDSLIGTDESGEAEGGEDSLLIPESVSAGPPLWSISRMPLGTSTNMSIGRLSSMLHVLMDGAQDRRTP